MSKEMNRQGAKNAKERTEDKQKGRETEVPRTELQFLNRPIFLFACLLFFRGRSWRLGGYNQAMKLILAIIQPSKLEAVKEALNKVEVFRLTIIDVQGFGRQKGHSEVYRGHELTVNLLRKVQLQIAVNEDFVEPTVNAIMEAGRTGPEGRIGDGKIFILPLEDCIRIRTGERGPEAI